MVNKFRSHFVDELETFTINIRFLCIRFTWFFVSSDNTFFSIIFRRRWNNLRITLVKCHRENLISNELLSDNIWDMHYSDYSQVVGFYSFLLFDSIRYDSIRCYLSLVWLLPQPDTWKSCIKYYWKNENPNQSQSKHSWTANIYRLHTTPQTIYDI